MKSEDGYFSYGIQLSNDILILQNVFVCVVYNSLEPADQLAVNSAGAAAIREDFRTCNIPFHFYSRI